MKVSVGSIVKLDPVSYPRYKGKTGIAMQEMMPEWGPGNWVIMIEGKLHPYVVNRKDIKVVDERSGDEEF